MAGQTSTQPPSKALALALSVVTILLAGMAAGGYLGHVSWHTDETCTIAQWKCDIAPDLVGVVFVGSLCAAFAAGSAVMAWGVYLRRRAHTQATLTNL